jgi:hypothetical protein
MKNYSLYSFALIGAMLLASVPQAHALEVCAEDVQIIGISTGTVDHGTVGWAVDTLDATGKKETLQAAVYLDTAAGRGAYRLLEEAYRNRGKVTLSKMDTPCVGSDGKKKWFNRELME